MNSYMFGSVELRRSILLTVLYSMWQFVTVVVAAEAEQHERLLERGFGGQTAFDRIVMKREVNQAEHEAMLDRPEFDRRIILKREVNQESTNTGAVNSNLPILPPKVTPDPSSKNQINGSSTVTHATLGVTTTEKSLDGNKLNCSLEVNVNKTECVHLKDSGDENSFIKQMSDNKEMLLRTLYVTLGVTSVILVYFVARAVWLRLKRTKSRKYRIIAQNGDQRDLEMEPLGDGKDDEDEDYTVFELNGRKK